jgi:hypothetical protein
MEITAKIVVLWVLLWTHYPIILSVAITSGKAMVLWTFLCLGYAVALPIACHCCQENAPSWYGSGGIMLGIACIGGVGSFILWILVYILLSVASLVGAAFSILVEVLVAAGVYAAVIPGVTLGKGAFIYGVQCLLVLTSALVLFFGYVLCFGYPVISDFPTVPEDETVRRTGATAIGWCWGTRGGAWVRMAHRGGGGVTHPRASQAPRAQEGSGVRSSMTDTERRSFRAKMPHVSRSHQHMASATGTTVVQTRASPRREIPKAFLRRHLGSAPLGAPTATRQRVRLT